MKKSIRNLFVAVFVLMTSTITFAQNGEQYSWLQFRGNNHDGISLEADLPASWPETGLKQLWKVEIGEAFSEVLVEAQVCYTMSSEKTDSVTGSEFLHAFDANTGKEIWKTKVDTIFIDVDGWGDGPRSTPAVDNKNIYCFSGCGKLTALSKADGKILWAKDFVKEYGSKLPRWGYSTSPILINNLLIMETGGTENRAFTAFNKATGEVIWSNGDGQSAYCSPNDIKIDGKNQIVFINNRAIHSLNYSGDTLWSIGIPLGTPTAMPVFIAPNKIFASAVSRTGGIIIEVNDNKPEITVTKNSMKNHWSSSCYHDNYMYGFDNATLKCISADSLETKWTKRGLGKGSLIIADKKLYALSDKGKLVLIEATPNAYKELASFQALEGKSWTAPSIVNGRIYLRNLTEMACYKLK